MAVCPETAMSEVRLVALRLDPVHIILRSLAGDRLAADQDHRRIVDAADRLERRLCIVAQVDKKAGCRKQSDVIDQNRGAVGSGPGDAIVGQRAAASYDVLDDD